MDVVSAVEVEVAAKDVAAPSKMRSELLQCIAVQSQLRSSSTIICENFVAQVETEINSDL